MPRGATNPQPNLALLPLRAPSAPLRWNLNASDAKVGAEAGEETGMLQMRFENRLPMQFGQRRNTLWDLNGCSSRSTLVNINARYVGRRSKGAGGHLPVLLGASWCSYLGNDSVGGVGKRLDDSGLLDDWLGRFLPSLVYLRSGGVDDRSGAPLAGRPVQKSLSTES